MRFRSTLFEWFAESEGGSGFGFTVEGLGLIGSKSDKAHEN